MSTVKNYDAENFTSSEIEIKSGQNYEFKFANARNGQISWDKVGDDIVVTVGKPLNKEYQTFNYFKKEYTLNQTVTEVVEKKEVIASTTAGENNLVTEKITAAKIEANGDNWDVTLTTQTRTLTDHVYGEFGNETEQDKLVGKTTAEVQALLGWNSEHAVVAADNALGQGETVDKTKVSAYTVTTKYYQATEYSSEAWQYGNEIADRTVVVYRDNAGTGADPVVSKIKTTVIPEEEDVVEVTDNFTGTSITPTKYTYSVKQTQYKFAEGNNAAVGFGEGADVTDLDDVVQTTAIADTDKVTYYKKTYDYKGTEIVPEGGYTEQTTAFTSYNASAGDVYTGEVTKLTLKNAATFGQDYSTEIGLVVRDANGNCLVGETYEHDEVVYETPLNLITNNYEGYTIAGTPDSATTPTKYTFTGSTLNENATSTAKDDTFNLGTGADTINISLKDGTNFVKFGADTVIGSVGEQLTVNFTGFDSDVYKSDVSYSGKDVILTIKGKETTTDDLGSITFQGLNEKNVFGMLPQITGLENDFALFTDPEAATVTYNNQDVTKATATTMTGTWRNDTAATTALNDTINLGTGYDEISVKALNNGNDTVIANKGEELVLNYDNKDGILQNTAGLDVAKITVKGSDVVASTEVEYYATMTVKGFATITEGTGENAKIFYTMDGQKITGYDFDNAENGEVTVKFVLAKYGSPDEDMAGKMLWRSENAFYKTTAYPDGVYLFVDNANFAGDDTEMFGGLNIKNSTLKVYESINGAEGVDVTAVYKTKYTDLATFSTFNEKLLSAATASTVTVKDALTSGAYVTVDGKTVNAYPNTIDTLSDDVKEQLKASNTLFEAEDVVAKTKKGKLDLSKATNDKIISLTGYVSENGKGANIITKAGNDTIVGSDYNDTLNLKAGNNIVSEAAGTNKITTGKGDDVITISNYASATIKTAGGNNEINLDSIGTNKFTGGNGVDTVDIRNGYNTVKAGKGTLVAEADGGNNNITGGKKADDIRITDGLNKINAGAGDDYLIVKGGHNTITLGKGNDEIIIDDELVNAPSNNIIKGTAGNNKYTINGGQNVITGGKNIDEFIFSGDSNSFVNGGKGNDIYNLKDYDFEDGALSIKDTKGKNTVVLSGSKDDYDVYFNVTAKKNKKGVVSLKSIGKTLELSNEDGTVSITTDGKTAKNGTLSNLKVSADSDYSVNVKKVANEVVAWLSSSANDTGLLSTDAIFASSGNDAAKAALQGIYNGNGYTDANNNVIAAQVNMFV